MALVGPLAAMSHSSNEMTVVDERRRIGEIVDAMNAFFVVDAREDLRRWIVVVNERELVLVSVTFLGVRGVEAVVGRVSRRFNKRSGSFDGTVAMLDIRQWTLKCTRETLFQSHERKPR